MLSLACNCKDIHLLLTQNLHLEPPTNEDHNEFWQLNINYCSAVWLLNHLSQYTRPDISFAVSSLARFNTKPSMTHWTEVRKVWKYLKTTRNLKLTIKFDSSQDMICGYSNSTWGDDPVFQKSQTGYIVLHYGSPIVWNSSRQRNITYSSTESELNALLNCYLELKWISHLAS